MQAPAKIGASGAAKGIAKGSRRSVNDRPPRIIPIALPLPTLSMVFNFAVARIDFLPLIHGVDAPARA